MPKKKPNGYWTKERCAAEAKKYDTFTEFQKYAGAAANATRRNTWIDDICQHMVQRSSSNGYWTKERCQQEALKYDSISEFRKYGKGAVGAATQNGWWKEITSHMTPKRCPDGYWTEERCRAESRKHQTKTAFNTAASTAVKRAKELGIYDEITAHMVIDERRDGSKPDGYWTKSRCLELAANYDTKADYRRAFPGAFLAAYQNGWWEEVSQLLTESRTPNGYWTKNRCRTAAQDFEHRSDFKGAFPTAYARAREKGWLDDVCAHMTYLGNRGERYVYQIEFSDGSVYVGLTYNPEERLASHKLKTKQLKNRFKRLEHRFIVSELMTADDAALEEIRLIDALTQQGRKVLNKNRGGSLGGSEEYWTKSKCAETALLFETRTELKAAHPGCYGKMRKEKWIEELCQHMRSPGAWTRDRQAVNHWESGARQKKWTFERCKEEAQKYTSRGEFANGPHKGAYKAAWNADWLDEICGHMDAVHLPNGHWTEESITAEALKCQTWKEFYTEHRGAYAKAVKLGLTHKVRQHFDGYRSSTE